MKKYNVIGVMSGTSVDGLDISFCRFIKNKKWKYEILNSKTYHFSNFWKKTLINLHLENEKKIKEIDIEFAKHISDKINHFVEKNKIKADIISSHGHTVFHDPSKKITLQIGSGKVINELCKITTVNNFRKIDIKLGGQGAPLVPIGDKLLFQQYKYCLNIGGFANLSVKANNSVKAFDICPANIALNFYCRKLGKEFDSGGEISRSGNIINSLYDELNKIQFYSSNSPKSLSREWLEQNFLTKVSSSFKIIDILRTIVEHIAFQIGTNLKSQKTLVTGGGAKNKFLMDRICDFSSSKIIIPSNKLIDFKEAMIFGFLAVLRLNNEINCLKSVTGAVKDSIVGDVYKLC